ncbi:MULTISPECIES: DUF485 domain-containing protein [Ectothiorhodospira]|uniref:Membrane protein n=1 Tax=Ectothiorhodospira haloalkaliphila TaxID=421628 RepID=W8KQP9_9GAMM|nr:MULTISPECIES: DUF485 domain-containing protein [Ectothiorhodospira]AHK79342.1 membrane protein [Ectothiorhodospira haloalkaliphila]ANB03242.1 membrane protein [Ectothiorhodospira sp. BSL-9]MCG5495416.1 DUF485 domain-containing protein [Ectothiorhodospira variabilis]MCG5497753.1 DUF485 domain-containing protein [Ectothiorhodospira variabilis]MCG5505014.1 DUF485 domain-containing protein [Ectothiorhodospira variabilis]
MDQSTIDRIKADPNFQRLVKKRSRLAWSLSAIMLLVYYSFIMLVAFLPDVLAIRPFGDSIITLGVPMGVGIILFAFMLTGIYVYKANTEFDKLTAAVRENAE